MRDDLEAQARELRIVVFGPEGGVAHPNAYYSEELDKALVAFGRRLLAESRAGIQQDVKKVLEGFEIGLLVRDTSHDYEPGWSLKLAPYLAALAKLAALAAEDEPGAQPSVVHRADCVCTSCMQRGAQDLAGKGEK